jgi:hypothetical protein
LFIHIIVRCFVYCNIRQVCVTSSSVTVPGKHGGYCLLDLGAAHFIDAAGIHPELFQAMFGGLFATESDLGIAGGLGLRISLRHVFETDLLFVIKQPSMRQYSIPGELFSRQIPGEFKCAIPFALKEPHLGPKALED